MQALLIHQGKYTIGQIHEPWVTAHGVLVRVLYSSVSFGTESNTKRGQKRGTILKDRRKWEKAIQLLKQQKNPFEVVHRYRNLQKIYDSVGYSAIGEVLAVGRLVKNEIQAGDLVHVSGEFASHQQVVCIPENMVFKLPETVKKCSKFLPWLSIATITSVPYHAVHHALDSLKLPVMRRPRALIVGGGIIGTFAGLFLRDRFDVFCYDLAENVMADRFFSRMHGERDFDLVVYSTSSMQGSDEILSRCADGAVLSIVGETPLEADRSILEEKMMTVRFCKSFGYGRGDKSYEEGLTQNLDPRFPHTLRRNISACLDFLMQSDLSETHTDLLNINKPLAFMPQSTKINVIEWGQE